MSDATLAKIQKDVSDIPAMRPLFIDCVLCYLAHI